MDEGDGYKVKRLSVDPGHSTSLQFHKYRSERWTVVEGVATVVLGNEIHKISKNECIFIPKEEKHDEYSPEDLEEALNLINIIKPKKAILTNLHTDLDYFELKKILPKNIIPAYDGLSFTS